MTGLCYEVFRCAGKLTYHIHVAGESCCMWRSPVARAVNVSDEAKYCSQHDHNEGCTNPTSQLHVLEIVLSSHK